MRIVIRILTSLFFLLIIFFGYLSLIGIETKKFNNQISNKIKEFEKKYPDQKKVPRPLYWSGWRLVPKEIEFWLEIKNRVHERLNYKMEKNSWIREVLYP